MLLFFFQFSLSFNISFLTLCCLSLNYLPFSLLSFSQLPTFLSFVYISITYLSHNYLPFSLLSISQFPTFLSFPLLSRTYFHRARKCPNVLRMSKVQKLQNIFLRGVPIWKQLITGQFQLKIQSSMNKNLEIRPSAFLVSMEQRILDTNAGKQLS